MTPFLSAARPLDQPLGQHRLDHDLAVADPGQGVGEHVDAADLLLEPVADRVGADLQDAHQVVRLGVVRQEQQAHVGVRGPQPLRGDQPAVRLRGHPDVQDRHVGGLGGQQLDQRVAVGRAADHLVARRLQQHQQALAEEGTVLGQRYSHGILTVIVPMPVSRRAVDRSTQPPHLVEHRLGVPHIELHQLDDERGPHRPSTLPAQRHLDRRVPPASQGVQAAADGEVGGPLGGRAEPLVGRVHPHRRPDPVGHLAQRRARGRPGPAAAGRSCWRRRAAPAGPRAARPAGASTAVSRSASETGARCRIRPICRVSAEIRSAAPSCSWRSRRRRRSHCSLSARRQASTEGPPGGPESAARDQFCPARGRCGERRRRAALARASFRYFADGPRLLDMGCTPPRVGHSPGRPVRFTMVG